MTTPAEPPASAPLARAAVTLPIHGPQPERPTPDLVRQLHQWRPCARGQRRSVRAIGPRHHVQHHAVVAMVGGVAMRPPARRAQVHLHIAIEVRAVRPRQYRVTKVRPRRSSGPPGEDDP